MGMPQVQILPISVVFSVAPMLGFHDTLIKGMRWVAISMSYQKSTGIMDDIMIKSISIHCFSIFKNSVVLALNDLWIH